VKPDQFPSLRIQACEIGPLQHRGVIEGEGALFGREFSRGAIGFSPDQAQPPPGQGDGAVFSIAGAAEDQGVGQAGHAEAKPAFGAGFGLLGGQRKTGNVDDIVQHPHGSAGEVGQLLFVQRRIGLERRRDEAGQIDRPEKTGSIRRQHLFAAGIAGRDDFAMRQIVRSIDPIDEDHARFRRVIGGLHQSGPEIRGADRASDFAVEHQGPVRIRVQCGHEGVGNQNREIEIPEADRVAFGVDEGLDVRMVDAQTAHHRPAPLTGGHDGAAHRIPHVHETERTRGLRPDPSHESAGGADCGKVHADAAALLQGDGGFAQMLEDAVQIVRDDAHDETVEQGHGATSAGAGEDSSSGQEPVGVQRLAEPGPPSRPGLGRLRFGQGGRHTVPCGFDGSVSRPLVRAEAIFAVPDFSGQGTVERHSCTLSKRGAQTR